MNSFPIRLLLFINLIWAGKCPLKESIPPVNLENLQSKYWTIISFDNNLLMENLCALLPLKCVQRNVIYIDFTDIIFEKTTKNNKIAMKNSSTECSCKRNLTQLSHIYIIQTDYNHQYVHFYGCHSNSHEEIQESYLLIGNALNHFDIAPLKETLYLLDQFKIELDPYFIPEEFLCKQSSYFIKFYGYRENFNDNALLLEELEDEFYNFRVFKILLIVLMAHISYCSIYVIYNTLN